MESLGVGSSVWMWVVMKNQHSGEEAISLVKNVTRNPNFSSRAIFAHGIGLSVHYADESGFSGVGVMYNSIISSMLLFPKSHE